MSAAVQPLDDDTDQNEAALWSRYRTSRDDTTRQALVTRYTRLVRVIAARAFSQRVSKELEFADYYQFGMVGLLQAIDRFDSTIGVRFESFASLRITGAVLDGVETLSEKQNQVVARQRAIKERAASLSERTHSRTDLFERLADMAVGLAIGFLLEDTGMYAPDNGSYGDNSYCGIELKLLRRRVQEAVRLLPEQERRVITQHYLQQQAFDEIAAQWSLTRGRVSQVHHSALKRLRTLLKPGDFL